MTTCSEGTHPLTIAARDIEIVAYPSNRDDAVLVQIDTGVRTGQMRIVLNDGPPVYEGDPEIDSRPTSGFGTGDVLAAARVLPDITFDQAAHVLSFFGAGGYAPGSHIGHILQAIATADPHRFYLLSTIYPEYCAAMTLARQSEGGIQRLQSVVNGA